MCIRDSDSIDGGDTLIWNGSGLTCDSDDDFLYVGDTIVVPVSYTHLRAHETVLDLVCRLLLEKKKLKINYLYLIL